MAETPDYPLSEKEFWEIYKKVPRLTVEVIVKSPEGIYLTQRNIEPCKGQWHLPGGTVQFGEKLTEAVARVAKRELGITVLDTKLIGYIEYPSHYENGLDSPVGIAFEVVKYTGDLTPDSEASDGEWFSMVPANMHDDQDTYLIAKNYLSR